MVFQQAKRLLGRKYHLEQDGKDDIVAAGIVSSPFLLGYLVGVGYVSFFPMGLPQPSLEMLLKPLPICLSGSLGMGSFCYYMRRWFRRAYKELSKTELIYL